MSDQQATSDPAAQHGFVQRARLRRRLRRLQAVREIALRDAGGLAYELHRAGRNDATLLADKFASLDRIDDEIANLQAALGAEDDVVELREAGVAQCPSCHEIAGSTDRFCASCGTQLGR